MRRRAVEVHPMPMPVLLRLINTWGDAPRVAAGEARDPYPGIDRLREMEPEFWSGLSSIDGAPVDAQTLIDTANRLHPVFAADSGDACAARLDGLVGDAALEPWFVADAWHIHDAFRSRRPERLVLASAVAAVIEQLRDNPDASRLGVCSGDDCLDAFVDESPSARREFCSLTCQNRARARAYRARKHAVAGARRP